LQIAAAFELPVQVPSLDILPAVFIGGSTGLRAYTAEVAAHHTQHHVDWYDSMYAETA
jgi:hypothetical protein